MYFRLKELRENQNLSLNDIAKILNITYQTYHIYEKFDRIIPLKHLNTLSNFYNISLDYIVGLSSIKTHSYLHRIKALNYTTISKNVIYIRIKYNLTQKQLADKIDVHPTTISKIEKNINHISTDNAITLCKCLNISLDWLVGKSDKFSISNY